MKKFRIHHIIVALFALSLLLSVPAVAAESAKVDINTASAEELTQLKGVGPKLAGKIIEYREAHQGFKTPEEILEVKGFGPKTLEQNKEMITVGTPVASQPKQ